MASRARRPQVEYRDGGAHPLHRLVEASLTCIAEGRGRVFGAAILRKHDPSLVIAECNVDNEYSVRSPHRDWRGSDMTEARQTAVSPPLAWRDAFYQALLYELPPESRPGTQDCSCLTTREPRSLYPEVGCALPFAPSPESALPPLSSAITWSGFDNSYLLFTHNDAHAAATSCFRLGNPASWSRAYYSTAKIGSSRRSTSLTCLAAFPTRSP